MKIKVFNERNNETKQVNVKSIKEVIKKLKINLEEVIIIKNNELVTEDAKLKINDEIKFLSVISGG